VGARGVYGTDRHRQAAGLICRRVDARPTRTQSGKQYQYIALATRRASTIEKEFAQAAAEGWGYATIRKRTGESLAAGWTLRDLTHTEDDTDRRILVEIGAEALGRAKSGDYPTSGRGICSIGLDSSFIRNIYGDSASFFGQL
jgi:hypothetical protein